MKPSFKQLRYICAVAEYKHFSKAAQACFVTQSTLSAAIQELESQLGVAIFERSKKSVLITPIGEQLLKQARLILGEVEDFVSLAKTQEEALAGDIRLGVIPTIAPFLLPHLLKELRSNYTKLKLFLKEDISAQLYQQLLQGQLDLIILAFPYPLPEMESTSLFKDEFLLCLPPGHQLEKSKQVKQAQLRGESLLLLEEGHCLRDHALEACKLEKAETALVYQGTSLHTLVQMVANGLGVTLLPAISIQADVLGDTHLQLKHFSNENVSREIGMAWRKSDPRREEYLLLADFIRNNAPSAKSITR
ncbi:MAG: hydrogen peroxide-inducible genes activator [Gammaproteobacteria bacterium]|nr:hydrogen peroxide-inducible genes activator [Gammaproteobacteria bacterium]MDD9896349.1 hydrogen peroxide-inducible genes activator [Gammaproteobacteria bacterium]